MFIFVQIALIYKVGIFLNVKKKEKSLLLIIMKMTQLLPCVLNFQFSNHITLTVRSSLSQCQTLIKS
jgi:hypothetical protein